MMKFIFAILLSGFLFAQSVHTNKDVQICKSKFKFAETNNLREKPVREIFIEVAKSFIGLDYAANTLQNENEEKLKIHLSGMDCYTFLEASLVFARLIKSDKNTFPEFEKEIENIRYRNGVMKSYPSRLHYFSDWLFDMDKRKILKLISEDIGGEKYSKQVNFMSKHPQYYKELKNNSEFVEEMCCIENEINSRKYFYIPQNKINSVEGEIKSGDIIGITTNIKGLDISHVGIAVKQNGRIHFLHAPNVGKKIQITKIPLAEYIQKNKKQTGIMVARILELEK